MKSLSGKQPCSELPFPGDSTLSQYTSTPLTSSMDKFQECLKNYAVGIDENLDSEEQEGLKELIVYEKHQTSQNLRGRDSLSLFLESQDPSELPPSSLATTSSSSDPSDSSTSSSSSSTSSASSSSSTSSDSESPSDKDFYANYYYGTDDFQPNKNNLDIHGYLFYEYHEDAFCKSPITHVLGQAAGPCYPGSNTNSYRYTFAKADCSDLRLSLYNDTLCNSFVQSLRVKHLPACHKNQLSEHYLAYKTLKCSLGDKVPQTIKGIHLHSHMRDKTCDSSPVHLFESIPTVSCLHSFDSISMVYTCDATTQQYGRTLYLGAGGGHNTNKDKNNNANVCMGFHDTKYNNLNTCTLQVLPTTRANADTATLSYTHTESDSLSNRWFQGWANHYELFARRPQLKTSRNPVSRSISTYNDITTNGYGNDNTKNSPAIKKIDVYQKLFCDDFRHWKEDTSNNQEGGSVDPSDSSSKNPPGSVNGVDAFGVGHTGGIIAIVLIVLFAGMILASLRYCYRRYKEDGQLSLASTIPAMPSYHRERNNQRNGSSSGKKYKHKRLASNGDDNNDEDNSEDNENDSQSKSYSGSNNPLHTKVESEKEDNRRNPKGRGIELTSRNRFGSLDSADSEEGRGFDHDHYEEGVSSSDEKQRNKPNARKQEQQHYEIDDLDDNAYTVDFAPTLAEDEQEED